MAGLLDRLAPFKGTMPNALIHNWLIVPARELPGTPIGVTVDIAHQPTGADLDLFKEFGLIETKSIGIIGRQGFGKTFLMYMLLLYICGMDVGQRQSSILIHSLKRNKHMRPETAPLVTDLLGCTVSNPRTMGLNPLSRAVGLTFTEQFTWLVTVINLALDRVDGVNSAMREVLKHRLREAWSIGEDPSIPGLRKLLLQYVPDGLLDEDSTPQVSGLILPSGLTALSDSSHADLIERNPAVFEKAALDLYLALGIFEEDEFLGLFAGDHSSPEEIDALFMQRAISVDLKGLTPKARAALSITWAAIMASAMAPSDEDPDGPAKHPERVPAGMGIDEAYADWDNPVVAESLYRDYKTMRERAITMIQAFHRFRDLQDAIADERALKRASNAIKENEVWFLFRQASKDDIDRIEDFFGGQLPQYVLDDLLVIRKGYCWMIVPNQSPVKLMVMGTPEMVRHFNTESAHREILERWYKTGDPALYAEYLEATTPEDDNQPKEAQNEEMAGSAPS